MNKKKSRLELVQEQTESAIKKTNEKMTSWVHTQASFVMN